MNNFFELSLGLYGVNQSWPNLRSYLVICLKGLRKTTKNSNQNIQNLNTRTHEYEAVQ
jgi:hypothetical protein